MLWENVLFLISWLRTFEQESIVGEADAGDLQGSIASHAIPSADVIGSYKLCVPSLAWDRLLVPFEVGDGVSQVQQPLLVRRIACTQHIRLLRVATDAALLYPKSAQHLRGM